MKYDTLIIFLCSAKAAFAVSTTAKLAIASATVIASKLVIIVLHTATNKQLIAANMRPTTAAIACTTVMLVYSSTRPWVMRPCFGILAAERLVRHGVKGSNLGPVTWLWASKRPCLLLLREGAAAVGVDEFVLQFESFALADIVNYNFHIYIAAACIHKDCNHIPRSHMPIDSTRHMQRKDFNMPLRIASIHTASHHSS